MSIIDAVCQRGLKQNKVGRAKVGRVKVKTVTIPRAQKRVTMSKLEQMESTRQPMGINKVHAHGEEDGFIKSYGYTLGNVHNANVRALYEPEFCLLARKKRTECKEFMLIND